MNLSIRNTIASHPAKPAVPQLLSALRFVASSSAHSPYLSIRLVARFVRAARSIRLRMSGQQEGFTVVELLVVMVIFGMVMGTLSLLFSTNLGIVNENHVRATLENNARIAARRIQEDIELAAQTLSTNQVVDTYNAGGWTAQTTHPGVLIAESLAIDTDDELMIDSGTFIAVKNNVVYYLDGTTLYRRMLANPTTLPGQTNSETSTCPPGTGGCKEDRKILENVKSFTIEHFDSGNNGPAGIVPEAATSTSIIFTLERKTLAGTVTINYTVRGTQRNTQ